MSIRQKIIRKIFRWSQALLEPPPPGSVRAQIIGTYENIPTVELEKTCNLLADYQEIELSTVTHNVGKSNQYTCVVLIGRYREGEKDG